MSSAIMLDVIGSRDYNVEQRGEIQHHMTRVCAALNGLFRGELIRETDFSAGNEIQGLFRRPQASYLYARLFAMLMYPVSLRGGIGVGSWDIRMENAGTTAQDGQVYYRARQAISDAAEQEQYGLLYFSGGITDTVTNSLMAASQLVRGVGAYQNELALLVELLSPLDWGGCLDLHRLGPLWLAAASRREYGYFARFLPERSPFDRPCPDAGTITVVDGESTDGAYFVTAGKPRGLPVTVSEYMGVSRQSIDKTLKTSNIFTARTFALSALRSMTLEGTVEEG